MTVLNERGRIWTLVAGGGASVIFADTIVEKSNVEDLANYGEYSGAPNEEQVRPEKLLQSSFHLLMKLTETNPINLLQVKVASKFYELSKKIQ